MYPIFCQSLNFNHMFEIYIYIYMLYIYTYIQQLMSI